MYQHLRAFAKPLIVSVVSAVVTTKYRLGSHGRVRFGPGFVANHKLIIRGPGRVIFGASVNAWAHGEPNVLLTFTPEAVIRIGDHVRLNGAGIQARCGITIGDYALLGSTLLVDSDFHSLARDRMTNPAAAIASAPITIGDNVWLAGQSAVLKGVTIGAHAVVGFRAVVTHEVPPNVVVAGNPARIVRHLSEE